MPKNTPQRIIDQKAGTSGALFLSGGAGGSAGVTDHGLLTGLADDDHGQYHNDARGDARYVQFARQVIAGAGLTGGGDLSADRTLAVGAGDGITVAADAVALASTVAGAGLTYSTGVLAVGAGAGLVVGADDVGLQTPGSLTVSSTNSATGSHTHAVSASADVGTAPAAALLKSTAGGRLTLAGLTTNEAVSLATFASGFAGSGHRIDYGVTAAGRSSAEFDDLTVRGRMRVYELLIQQIRATNGSLFVSSASRVVSVTTSTNPAWTVNGSQLTLNGQAATLTTTLYTISTAAAGDTSRELYHGFLTGDIIRAQQTRWDGSQFAGLIQSNLEVTAVSSLYGYTAALVSGDAAAVGYDYVRLGSSSDANRRGSVYITSDDSGAPFIDIVDGVASHSDWNSAGVKRVRLGKLSGISDAAFGGTLPGYGLYANNVYLRGQIVVTGGSLGGLAASDINANTTTIDGGKITANSIDASRINVANLAAINANLGTVTAGSIVVGSTNKLWLNDAADGKLAIGGATKASAPFSVAADGTLNTVAALIGNVVNVNNNGIYIAPQVTFSPNYGYKFSNGTSVLSGLTAMGTPGDLYLVANSVNRSAAVVANSNSAVNIDAHSSGSYASSVILGAYNYSRSPNYATLQLSHGTTTRALYLTADAAYIDTGGGNLKFWHEGNDGSGSGLDADKLDDNEAAAFALLTGATFSGAVTVSSNVNIANYIRLTPLSTAPAYQSGYGIIWCRDKGSGHYALNFKARSSDGTSWYNDIEICTI